MTIHKFDFADHARAFDNHIGASIPSYNQLRAQCVRTSQRFIQDGTTVIDIGCSTGRLLADIAKYNREAHRGVEYVGIDIEESFSDHWDRRRGHGMRFEVSDARHYTGYDNISLALSLFTAQFLPEKDKRLYLEKVFHGLVTGGSLIIAEKVYADTGLMQDALIPPFYDHKLKTFTEKQILDKERTLRGQMTSWTEDVLKANLRDVGFRDVQLIWASFPFCAVLAVK